MNRTRQIAILILSLFLVASILTLSGCTPVMQGSSDSSSSEETGKSNAAYQLWAASTSLHVGETVEIRVSLSGTPKCHSVGIQLFFSSDHFELVSGEMLLSSALSDFDISKKIGVMAFEQPIDANTTVAKFTLRAKEDVKNSQVNCTVSLENESREKSTLAGESLSLTVEG